MTNCIVRDKKLSITFLLPPVSMAGGIRVVAIYAKALQKMGHTVTIVSQPPKALGLRAMLKSLLRGKLPKRIKRHPSHVDNIGVPHTIIDTHRPIISSDVPDGDVVVATWWETAEWCNALADSKGKKVYFVQGHEVFENLPQDRCRASYRLPLKKITIAQWLVEVMRDEYGDNDVDLVPNSVDHSQFFAPPRSKQNIPTIGFLYNNATLKGIDIAIAAILKVKQRIPALKVLCFGSHPPPKNIELPDYFELHVDPPQDQIRHIYAACDAWITCSRSEGFNLPAMEAMACRTPVISTKTGWPAEAIQSKVNGFLVDIDDTNAVAEGIEYVLNTSESEWKTLSDNAYKTVEDSSWKKSAQLFESSLIAATVK